MMLCHDNDDDDHAVDDEYSPDDNVYNFYDFHDDGSDQDLHVDLSAFDLFVFISFS